MEAAGKPQPEFIDKGAEFLTILRIGNRAITERSRAEEPNGITVNDKVQQVVTYCSIPRSRGEIALHLEIGEEHAMRRYINPLLRSGKLKRTIPEKPRSRNQKYVAAR